VDIVEVIRAAWYRLHVGRQNQPAVGLLLLYTLVMSLVTSVVPVEDGNPRFIAI